MKIRKATYPEKTIWCFTGYLFDRDILGSMCKNWSETHKMLSYIDVLVDGQFIEAQKNLNLKFKGSENQRTILVKESLNTGNIVLLSE
jgi:anaerobic ribonucleoside-triphosphate reductase activating protein